MDVIARLTEDLADILSVTEDVDGYLPMAEATLQRLAIAGYEVVPASQLRGAVEALERIREDASAVCEQYEPGQLRSEVYALWKLADDALGGQ